MITRRALAGLVAAGAAGGAFAARAEQDGGRAAGRREEVRALRAFAERTHPRGREAAADPKWRSTWDELEANASRAGNGAYFVGLWRGLSWFRDGHTTAIPFEFAGGVPEPLQGGPFGQQLPWRVRTFHDGFFVAEARDEARPLLGARIVRVNGVSDVEIMRRLWAIWPGNEPWAQHWSWTLFNNAALLQGLGVAEVREPVRVEAVLDGRPVTATLRPRRDGAKDLEPFPRRQFEREVWAARYKRGNYVHPLPQSRTLYVSIDDMADVAGRTFEALTREAFAAMERPGLQRVVIDLRRNRGGNNFLPEALRKHLGRSRFNRPGGLYVLTGPATFSAAQNMANRLERETWAVFIGEPTGGAPNHYGDAEMFRGEATGVRAIVSTLPWFDSYPSDERAYIMPDLPQPMTFAAWRDGRDTALATALSHRATANADELNRARIFYFARPSQKVAWTPFWKA